ncbi:epimerase [Streptomyces ruber]|uniref:Epimerase n=2 Tax=Streptomyces TaxID=1883 RepID=A0A918BJM6_9ACTN|nr:sugar phosphate isomerase/epimerase family protein [Streptomyces ruber]GGQ68569.1 epimerase [Streptomyces ruber]
MSSTTTPQTPDNPLGVHALVWTGDWTPEGARLAARQSRAAGYDLVEISLHDMDVVDVRATRAALAEHGLDVACSRGLAFDADVSSDDPDTARRGEELLSRALHLAGDLGAGYFCGVLYSALGKYAGPPTARGREHAVRALRRLAAQAADRGITLGMEVVNRYESNLVNTARQALDLIDEVGADNVKVHLDTYHMNIEEQDFTRPVLDCGDRLGYVHVGDSHRGYLGSGTIDFQQFFHALGTIGYTGPITFESFSSAVVAPGLSNDLAVWRNLWSDGPDLAAHARSFMAGQLKAARAGLAG